MARASPNIEGPLMRATTRRRRKADAASAANARWCGGLHSEVNVHDLAVGP